jgi:hypothetical protein
MFLRGYTAYLLIISLSCSYSLSGKLFSADLRHNDILYKKRKPRLLWANVYCLLDSSSGASMSVREMLRQLVFCGYEVEVIGATIFDAESGLSALPEHWKKRLEKTDILELRDTPLVHKLLMTNSHQRDAMTAFEEAKWYEFYLHTLDSFRPDLVWFYGGRPFDYLISDEAKQRSIPVAAYLVNGNYTKTRWCRDVDLIVTDTRATAEYYYCKNGLTLTPVGKFIDPVAVVVEILPWCDITAMALWTLRLALTAKLSPMLALRIICIASLCSLITRLL